jgi:AcrR family transcriptional regulator
LTADERRSSILRAARGVFARHGFHGASTAEIAAAASCSEPTLYKHFPSKHALFAAVIGEAGLEVKRRVLDALDGAADPLASLLAVSAQLMADPAWAELSRLRSLAVTMTDDDAIREVLRHSTDGHWQTVTHAVAAGQASGAVRDDVDPELVGWLAVAISVLANHRNAIEGPAGLADMPRVMDALSALISSRKEPA